METCLECPNPGKTTPVRAADLWISSALTMSVLACESATPDRAVTTSADTNVIAPNVVTPKVTWPAATTRDARAFAVLGEATRATELLGRSPVPVLAPTNVQLERPTFVVGAEYYALTGRVNGATIAIQGTRAAKRYEGIAPVTGDRNLRGGKGFVSVNEGIRTSSWMENGASYSIDVECADPTESRCASDAFVIDLVEHLAFAGGAAR